MTTRRTSADSRLLTCSEASVCVWTGYLQDLVPDAETLLLSRTPLLNTGNEDADVVSSSQPQADAVALLEVHHHRVGPAVGPSQTHVVVS